MESSIIRLEPYRIENMQQRFELAAGIKTENIKKAHRDAIIEAKEIIYEKTYIESMYSFVKIREKTQDSVILENGKLLSGQFICKVLEDSQEVSIQVTSLKGFDELPDYDNLLLAYYIDVWGSAAAGQANRNIAGMISREIKESGKFTTSLWSPGQHGFPLKNQMTVFDSIDAGKIGVYLSERNIMTPSKSASGIMGIRESADDRQLFPCRFCSNIEGCANEDAVRYRELRKTV